MLTPVYILYIYIYIYIIYVMGDFNSDFTRGDLFGDEFMQICNEHSLSIADK